MKVTKVELLIIDFDKLGEDGILEVLESTRYPNHCMSPKAMRMQTVDVGEWSDDHPLNKRSMSGAYIEQLFADKGAPKV